MNFKDSYKKENEEIKPDAAFVNQLAGQMEREKRMQRNRKKMIASTGVVAAAAAMCVLVLHGVEPLAQRNEQDIQNKAEVVETQTTGHSFGNRVWYGDAETEEEMFQAFLTLLKEEKIEKLYCSDMEEYLDEDVVSEKEADKLIKKLCSAELTEAEADGACKHYMAVFENGKIVKFEIYGDKYLKLKDSEALYSL